MAAAADGHEEKFRVMDRGDEAFVSTAAAAAATAADGILFMNAEEKKKKRTKTIPAPLAVLRTVLGNFVLIIHKIKYTQNTYGQVGTRKKIKPPTYIEH